MTGAVVDKTRRLRKTIYAFLSYTLSNSLSALSVIHSLIFQLASEDDDLQDVLRQTSKENLKSSIETAKSLLRTLLSCIGHVYIVIDGVDEIEEIERLRLLTQLLDLSKDCDNAKVLISSRAEADINSTLKTHAQIRVDNQNIESIEAFVSQKTQQWFGESEFSAEARAEIKSLLAPLASTSKG